MVPDVESAYVSRAVPREGLTVSRVDKPFWVEARLRLPQPRGSNGCSVLRRAGATPRTARNSRRSKCIAAANGRSTECVPSTGASASAEKRHADCEMRNDRTENSSILLRRMRV